VEGAIGIRVHDSPAEVAHAAAEVFADCARAAVKARGVFRVALSGGRTPKALYHILASPAYRDLPWSEMDFFWGDERCVPATHNESNFRSADANLLKRVPVIRDRIYAVPGCGDAQAIATTYEKTLRRVFAGDSFPRFDLNILGLGQDGHTASLFPHGKSIAEKERWVVASYAPEGVVRSRITLTVPAINSARRIVFLITGGNKSERLRELLEEDFPPEKMPARAIAPVEGECTILCDKAAAARLSST
jgi:6-phosphogluconolactonase